MKITEESIVGTIVAQNYLAAEIFKKYKIDFCCNGNRSIIDACGDDVNIASLIIVDLNQLFDKEKNATFDYQKMSLNELVSYIEKKHHKYVEAQIPIIKEYLTKICNAHGFKHPELFEVNLLFNRAADELVVHMKKEELILFPYIREIENAGKSNREIKQLPFGSVKRPIDMMESDHDQEGKYFRRMEELTSSYKVPEDGCSTYSVCMSLLKQFEEDLHLHIHLENNILFPQSIIQEKEYL